MSSGYLSPYLAFYMSFRKEHPEFNKKENFAESGKQAGIAWKKIKQDEKELKKYELLAAKLNKEHGVLQPTPRGISKKTKLKQKKLKENKTPNDITNLKETVQKLNKEVKKLTEKLDKI